VDLDHLNLRVRDATACRAFYERWFGFRLAFEAEGGCFLRNDARFLLALVPADDHRPLPRGVHIGFSVRDPAEIDRLHAEMAAAGVTVGDVERDDGGGYVSFRCWDPDGTEVELFWDGP
jgi:catechol 2,3-dioxygenase-like lactoylglutathione lyase family enzyme